MREVYPFSASSSLEPDIVEEGMMVFCTFCTFDAGAALVYPVSRLETRVAPLPIVHPLPLLLRICPLELVAHGQAVGDVAEWAEDARGLFHRRGGTPVLLAASGSLGVSTIVPGEEAHLGSFLLPRAGGLPESSQVFV